MICFGSEVVSVWFLISQLLDFLTRWPKHSKREREVLQGFGGPASAQYNLNNILLVKAHQGTSLVLQSLRIQLPMQGTRVQSPMGELRSHRPQGNRAYRPHLEKAHSLQRRPSTAKIESKSRGKFRFKGSKNRFHLWKDLESLCLLREIALQNEDVIWLLECKSVLQNFTMYLANLHIEATGIHIITEANLSDTQW